VERGVEEVEEEAECDMAGTTSFIQANRPHSITVSRVLSRTVSVKEIDTAVIQEPWYREGRIRGLSVPGYTLFCAGGIDRPRACILRRNKTTWMLPGFACRDLVAVLINCNEEGGRKAVDCSAYLSCDSEEPPTSQELEEFLRYCESENLYIV
jgi:hypothetical protein